MTTGSRLPATTQRDSLRARIEAAERRNAERSLGDTAREAAKAAVDYTRANPLTVIGGALAVGLAIGLLTRPGRRAVLRAANGTGEAVSGVAASAASGVKQLASKGGSKLGTMLGEAAVAYAMTLIDDALDAAREGQGRAAELGEAASTKARGIAGKSRDTAGRVVAEIKRKTKG
ncbi:hypothetical protein [Porphyrobacter sp. LM 6]|jgi:hypothetical protein|uniref:hypothetical protein n=1 Tax=Porphyrobacter sp. LM 6 TaxID=1896196 RepID=UPI0008474686|nr:hypothetical protein [Porphyrobacter sp. LM 6]AOL94784.1 hypothetical protein BG023_111865 [Porphyrobacter sp. LM 6]